MKVYSTLKVMVDVSLRTLSLTFASGITVNGIQESALPTTLVPHDEVHSRVEENDTTLFEASNGLAEDTDLEHGYTLC